MFRTLAKRTFPAAAAKLGLAAALLVSASEVLSANEPAAITASAHLSAATDEIQNRLSTRYRNPVIARLVQSVSTEQALAIYREASRLIDGRHLEPSAYEQRVKRAVLNLVYGLENPDFLQANRVTASAASRQALRESLLRLISSQSVRSSADAENVLRWTMELAHRQLGLRPTSVVIEYVYAATESLDKYSAFEPEMPRAQPSAGMRGSDSRTATIDDHLVGIGVEIKPHDDGVLVVKALRGGPAARAGIKAGDIMTQVSGRNLAGQSLDLAVDLIAGPVGSTLTLRILRDGRSHLLTLARARVAIYSVGDVELLGSDQTVGYIKLDKFASSSEEEMDRALWQLHQRGMKSLIVDVRGNPGGLLTTAIALSDKFVPSGAIVSTRGRTAGDNSAEQAKYEQTWKVPLVVLIDGDSASASEIFPAAIQENNRGLVVGEQSFGKGTVQTHFPLQSVAGNLRLTTAMFYSPRGRAMAGAGVTPDIQAESHRDDPQRDQALGMAIRVAGSSQLKELAARATTRPTSPRLLEGLSQR